jgi:SAM-dependent methyltransferase
VADWGLGSYERIAEQLLPAAELAVREAAPGKGERVVDVGCGTGNASLLAAARGATVTGVDPSQRLLDVGTAEAAERGLDATFVLGKAADMPLGDGAADVVLSVFGVIFAPDPAAAAAEIGRVATRPARIVLVAWVPGGPISQAVRLARDTVAEILDQPPAPAPFPWHELDAVTGLFGPHGFSGTSGEHQLPFHAPSIDEFMRIEGENHPLAIEAQPVLEKAGRAEELREGMCRIYKEANEDPDAFKLTSSFVVMDLRRD